MERLSVSALFSGFKKRINSASGIDWLLFFATIPILGAGLLTMNSFVSPNALFTRQVYWAVISLLAFFFLSFIDFRFLRRTAVLVALFLVSVLVLVGLFIVAREVRGTQSWLTFGGFSIEPVEPIKLVLILILAKYFSRRHIEIANIRHIFVSGFYAFVIFSLVLLQPDFGSAMIIFCIWLGMVTVSGISKKHLAAVFLILALSFAGLWGKGVGLGSQSRLNFLPEYETDFIFAAFAEEWGFVGVVILLGLYSVLIWRILLNSMHGATNFEILFGFGLAVFFISHIFIHIGMNIGLLPITGITLPFASYGGSHLITEFAGLGILMGMRRYSHAAHKDVVKNEFLGPR